MFSTKLYCLDISDMERWVSCMGSWGIWWNHRNISFLWHHLGAWCHHQRIVRTKICWKMLSTFSLLPLNKWNCCWIRQNQINQIHDTYHCLIKFGIFALLLHMSFYLSLVWMRASPPSSHMFMSTFWGQWRTINPFRWFRPVTWRFMPFPLTSRTALWPFAAGSTQVKPHSLYVFAFPYA